MPNWNELEQTLTRIWTWTARPSRSPSATQKSGVQGTLW